MDLLAVFITLALIVVTLVIRVKRSSQSNSKQIPTPYGQSEVAPRIAEAGSFKTFFQQTHDKHGKVVSFNLGGATTVSVADPDCMKDLLKVGSRPTKMFEFLEDLLGDDNMQVYSGARAKGVRSALQPPLQHENLKQNFPEMLELATMHLEALVPGKTVGSQANGVPIQHKMLCFAMEAAVQVLLGVGSERGDGKSGPKFDHEKFAHAYHTVMDISIDKMLGKTLNAESQQDFEAMIQYLEDETNRLIDQRLAAIERGETEFKDMLQILLTKPNPETNEPFTRDKIHMLVKLYVIAAYHTSVVATGWTLFRLTQNPDVFAKVKAEVTAQVGNRPPTESDLQKLPYVTAVIREALRITPPGPFAARLAEEDITVGGYEISKGTTVLIPIEVIHHLPEYWDRPAVFDPARFVGDIPKLPHRFAYIPFGIGSRLCPGERMSWMEIKLLLTLMVQRYAIKLDMPLKDVVEEEKFVTWAKNDILLQLTRI